MELQTLTLRQLVVDALKYLQQQHYSELTIARHRGTWNHLIKYAESKKIQYYTLEHGMNFITQQYGVGMNGKNSSFHEYLIRSIRILYEIQEFKSVKTKRITAPLKKPIHFLSVLEDYSENLKEHSLSYKTIKQQKYDSTAKRYF